MYESISEVAAVRQRYGINPYRVEKGGILS